MYALLFYVKKKSEKYKNNSRRIDISISQTIFYLNTKPMNHIADYLNAEFYKCS